MKGVILRELIMLFSFPVLTAVLSFWFITTIPDYVGYPTGFAYQIFLLFIIISGAFLTITVWISRFLYWMRFNSIAPASITIITWSIYVHHISLLKPSDAPIYWVPTLAGCVIMTGAMLLVYIRPRK